MLVGRIAGLLVLGVACVVAPVEGVTSADRWIGVLACAVALAVHAGLGLLPQRDPRALLTAVDAALVVDAGLIVVLASLSGGPDSPALWLLPLLALAATLGLSAANGAKALVLGGIAVAAVHLVDSRSASSLAHQGWLLAFSVATVVIAAGLTTVNERELTRRRERVEVLHRASLDFEAADDAEALGRAAVDAARRLMPGWRAEMTTDRETAVERVWRQDGYARLEVPVAARPRGGADTGADIDADELLGVLALRRPVPSRGPVRIRGQQLMALRTLARTLAVALSRVDLLQRLEHMSASDPLTGLANRRVFDEDLHAELARARRSGAPVGLALVDVDHFKRFNDTHGHLAGDEALVVVARTLVESARAEDRVCRIGGEEFALILPGADAPRAAEVGERVRRAVEAIDIPYGRLTVSVGVVTSDGSDTIAALVAAADACLYRAKDEGRNRVVAPAVATG